MSAHDNHCDGSSQPLSRRRLLQAGTAGIAGISTAALMTNSANAAVRTKAKRVVFVFLTGGISHHDTFDMKPGAPAKVRGTFDPVSTDVAGIQISEHLPLFTRRMKHYAMVRSMGTGSNGHEQACHMMLTGRLDFPIGFTTSKIPSPNEWPSMLSVVTHAKRNEQRTLPPAAVLPEASVNEAARMRPGQFAGRLGSTYEAWHVNVAAQCPLGNGACPDCFRFDLDHHIRMGEPAHAKQGVRRELVVEVFIPLIHHVVIFLDIQRVADRSHNVVQRSSDSSKRLLDFLANDSNLLAHIAHAPDITVRQNGGMARDVDVGVIPCADDDQGRVHILSADGAIVHIFGNDVVALNHAWTPF